MVEAGVAILALSYEITVLLKSVIIIHKMLPSAIAVKSKQVSSVEKTIFLL